MTKALKFLHVLLASLALGSSLPASAGDSEQNNPDSVMQIPLRDLLHNRSIRLEDIPGEVILLSFFEPNCSWCHRQMKAFKKIQEQCDDTLQPVVVGINGNAQQLKKEVRRAKISYPALQANRSLLQYTGEIPATPWTLLLNRQGDTLATLRGYIPLEDYLNVFAEQCQA